MYIIYVMYDVYCVCVCVYERRGEKWARNEYTWEIGKQIQDTYSLFTWVTWWGVEKVF